MMRLTLKLGYCDERESAVPSVPLLRKSEALYAALAYLSDNLERVRL
jgi:hypothetical protein